MKTSFIIVIFISSVLMITCIGFYSLFINLQIISSFEHGEKQFETIAAAAAEVSSYAKRAEGHLMLYLNFSRDKDKEKFPQRIQSLNEQIAILDQIITDARSRDMLKEIKSRTAEIESGLESLMKLHDKDVKETGEFHIRDYSRHIFSLHKNFSDVRSLGVDLAKLEISLEKERKKKIHEQADTLSFYMALFLSVVFIFAVYTGYVIFNTLIRLRKEVAARRQSEKSLQEEHGNLKAALEKVNILSGLLPICASCKKIRDDKGYWNQIETYIKSNSDVRFTHGICPDCARRLYPDIDLE